MKTKVNKPEAKKQGATPFFSSRNSSGFFDVQPKLTTGKPGDKYEIEADNIADKVVNRTRTANSSFSDSANSSTLQQKPELSVQEKPLAETITPLVQKKELEEEDTSILAGNIQKEAEEEEQMQLQPIEEEEELQTSLIQKQDIEEEEVQAKSEDEEEEPVQMTQENEEEEVQAKSDGQAPASPAVETKLSGARSGGRKMDAPTRSAMESAFGADFSQVNIHTDEKAVQMSQQLGAQAFTHGNDVYFNKGKYNPDSGDGKHLLAHELTHTIQQTGMIPNQLQMTIGDYRDLQSDRFSGDTLLEACLDSEQALHFGSRGAAVSKMQQALVDAGFPLPIYGVDGIFELETQGALQNFQRSSSLLPTGVLDSATMSSLDALFYLDQPVIPVEPAADIAPEIISDTFNLAPDFGDTTRTTVGVGEMVRFYGNTAGTWTATEGRIIGLNTGENMVWEAPAVAANPAITLTTPAGTASINMTVITPTSLIMKYSHSENIPAGTAGACMITDVVLHPLNVNFGRVQFAEIPGPATNVTGYFNSTPDNLAHVTAGHFVPINNNNAGVIDHAYYHSLSAPYSAGTFQWVIPNQYKIDGESDSQGRFFVNTYQSFYFTSTGDLLIIKAGTFVLRYVNSTVVHGL